MPPESLRCKECKTTYPLDARYVCERCFGPLEVAYAARDGRRSRRAASAGSRPAPTRCGATATSCPCRRRPAGCLPAGWTPLLRADRLAEQLGLREVWIKNDAANPTHSFKDRVVSVALARARELGFQTVACASTGNLANAVAAHAAAAGPRVLRVHPVRSRGAEGARDRRLRRRTWSSVRGNYDDVNRLCTELVGRARVGVREHQHAARTTPRDRRRSRSRPPSSSASSCPTGSSPDRLGLAVHEDRARLRGVARARAARRDAADVQRRPGARLLAGRDARSRRAATSASRSSPTRSPSRWRSATRPTARTRSTWRAAPAARSTR